MCSAANPASYKLRCDCRDAKEFRDRSPGICRSAMIRATAVDLFQRSPLGFTCGVEPDDGANEII